MPRRMRTWLSGLVEKSGPHRWTLFNIFLKSRVGWKFLEDEEVSSAFDVFFSGRHVVGLMLSLSSCLLLQYTIVFVLCGLWECEVLNLSFV